MSGTAGSQRDWTRLVLVGFMGAGKSTVGALLASRLGLEFVDTDTILEMRHAQSIAQLFERYGETKFRRLEENAVGELLSRKEVVLAFGGGALESSATRRLLSDSSETCVIHLEASFPTMMDRCGASDSVRPLLRDQAALSQRHAARMQHYRGAGKTVLTDDLRPDEVVDRVLQELAVGLANKAR